MPPPPAARSHSLLQKAAPTTAQKARGSRVIDRRARFPHDAGPFHRNPAPRMRQPATIAAKPQRRSNLPPGYLQKVAQASAFIPQQRHQERNTKRKLFPRRGEGLQGFNFKPEEASNQQKMKRMYEHPWQRGLRGASGSNSNTSNHSNQCTD
ncbi:hypothetical protein GQ55_9G042200 [Panicum hallii var. hallii]|uniref:Uncharacterized protein n=1 Tax=Panicum hallii var. hallii TaxID=1504633 RepID=A0A2T7BZH8_9POAL|nr:hypothetical protein GQ55_9G042200 [Panicum hallii var. hallii]